jgi:acyl dehydratase
MGQVVSVKRTFTQSDFDRFAALSGDDNPIHVDTDFAAQTKFGRPVAHGMLLYGAVCGILGHRLPGPGTVQIEQDLMFPSPTYTDEEVTIRLEATEVQPGEGLADLSTVVTRPDGNVGLQGRTLVRLPGRRSHPDAQAFGGFEGSRERQRGAAESEDVSHKGLEIGQSVEARRTFTVQDLEEYADLSGDSNPVFTDPGYARKLGLEGLIIPGSLIGGMFSYLLGTRLPGRGTNYLKQQLRFPAFAHPGQELTAAIEIIRIRPEKQLVNLRTICTIPVGDGSTQSPVVCRGEALVLVSDVEASAERG